MKLQLCVLWRADQVAPCPEIRFILMKTEKPKFLKQPGSQRLPFQLHEEGTGAASGNRGHDEVAIAGI